MAALFSRTDDWWSNQPYGAVLHYDNGGGRYVRGIVVERDGHRHMLPIALVGRWEPHEIVTRAINGQPQYGPYAKMILDQETFQANATNMVEYPTHRLSGGDPRSDETALSLEPPALTPEQQALVYVASIHDQVMEALTYQRSADPIAQAAEIRRALLTAQSLLQPGKPSDVEVLAEARMLAKEYLLAADEELTTAAQTLKRKIAQAIVTAAED
jgi:hypothetical protein